MAPDQPPPLTRVIGIAERSLRHLLEQQLDRVVLPPTVPGIGDVVAPTWEQAVNEVVLGKADAKAALDSAAKKADALLEDNRKKYAA